MKEVNHRTEISHAIVASKLLRVTLLCPLLPGVKDQPGG